MNVHSDRWRVVVPMVVFCVLGLLVDGGYSQSGWEVPPPGAKKLGLSVSLTEPKSGEKITCLGGSDGIYRCTAKGQSTGLADGRHGLLLWARPVSPPSDMPGWYLQRPPINGVQTIEADGSWVGLAQLGNSQWPPHEGDTLDLAVSITDTDTVTKLMAERGVVLRQQPIGSNQIVLKGIVVTIKK